MRALVAVVVGVLLASACAERAVMRDGVRVPVTRAVERDLAAAKREVDAGRPEAARALLERARDEVGDERGGDEILFALGDLYVRTGDRDRALATFRSIVEEHPRSAREPEARFRMAELYRESGRPALAREVLSAARFERASDALRPRMYRLLADLARGLGDFAESVLWLSYLRREITGEEEAFAVDAEVGELLQERILDADLERLSGELPAGAVHDRVLLEVARRALARGDVDAAQAALDALPRRLRPAEEEQRQRLLEQADRGAAAAVRRIGIVLPLSGPYEGFGRSVLRGVVLSLGILEDPPQPYDLLVRDSAGDPDRAAALVRELAATGVVAILGPLRSAEAAAAAPEAEAAGVPLLTLAQREDLAFLGESVFRLGLTASDQVRALLDYAFERAGARRFAILWPRDDYGLLFKNLFWEEVERRGGEVVGAEGYTPGAADLQAEIKRLVGLWYLEPAEKKLVAERDRMARRPQENAGRLASPPYSELPPYVDFDALFVPDEAAQVGLILPQLRFYEIRDPVLLGPSGWNDPRLLEIAAREAHGSVFTDAFFARSAYPFVQDFVQRYYAAYAAEPDYLAAEGFDAVAILRSVLDRRAPSRGELRRALLSMRDFPGVSGLTSFDESGGTRKELYLLTVRQGSIEELGTTP
jgi:ABC-type branched-subunit amino acid transport system substrate-binding protein